MAEEKIKSDKDLNDDNEELKNQDLESVSGGLGEPHLKKTTNQTQ